MLWSHPKIRSNDKKIFFNAAANGLLDTLVKITIQKPELLKLGNKDSGKLAIFYSLKNRHLEATLFLYEMGQRFTEGELRSIVFNSRKPDQDYIFFTKIYETTTFNAEKSFQNLFKSKEEFNSWLFDRLKSSCYSRNDIYAIENLYQLVGAEPNWNEILTEYRTYKNIGNGVPNIKTLPFIREITLKYLLDEF